MRTLEKLHVTSAGKNELIYTRHYEKVYSLKDLFSFVQGILVLIISWALCTMHARNANKCAASFVKSREAARSRYILS